MALDKVERSSEEQRETPVCDLLIDTDIHEMMASPSDLVPYLSAPFKSHIEDFGWNHITMPTEFPYVVVSGDSGIRRDWVVEGKPGGSDLDHLRKHLFQGEKVSHGILNGFFYPSDLRANFGFAAELARAYNDWQVDNWLDAEPRLYGSIQIVADDPDVAVKEVERMARHPKMVQVFLPSSSSTQWGDPRYHRIFEAADYHGLSLGFHHSPSTRMAVGYPRNYVEWHTLAFPQAAQNQLVGLIFNGVFGKLPNLKAIFLETGVAWVPWLMWRIDQQYRELRVNVPWVKQLPSEYMRGNIRVATQPMSDVKIEHFVKMTEWTQSEDMFVFSTDYPHWDADSAVVLRNTLPEALRMKIRYQNAIASYPRLKGLAG